MGSQESLKKARTLIESEISKNKVQVFSKTYCPYCKMAKDALKAAGIDYNVMELDNRSDGSAIQDVLKEMTGARSVPRVFINGKCIGGGSETKALQVQGKLVQMVNAS
uniref:Glutaredoxin-2, mitochondrial n=1 Tax=Ciona intestinalis TaxID=7719 RepID=H2XT36_CIOIN|nr:glutaredoxin-like [Ciona intestinalis]|eukprot:XP_002125050.1 glutaredoxin-like [Ciona intestinalis]